MKQPHDCSNIGEIREAIDAIDKQVIDLLGQRFQYVKEIVRFKKNEEDVFARERYENVFKVRRTWAEANGLDPQTIEDAYKILVHYFIDEQKKLLHLD